MRLRNKKTGEIGYLYEHSLTQDIIIVYDVRGIVGKYTSLAKLNEEWEDYEEPKEYWYIDYDGGILCGETDNSSAEKMMISMGNHFESLEEAELAVRKLKAWKRLKDIGCRFILDDNFAVKFVGPEVTKIVSAEEGRILCDDYRLLFGSEE